MGKYLLNCFILLIPVVLWNIIFIRLLPNAYGVDFFWKDIPKFIGTTENTLRLFVFMMPVLMIFSLETKMQKIGFLLYILGVTLYFASWIFQIYFTESWWSKNLLGFMAPAYTTIIWFVGIALIGKTNFIKIPYYSAIYLGVSIIFVVFHTTHAYIVYQRI